MTYIPFLAPCARRFRTPWAIARQFPSCLSNSLVTHGLSAISVFSEYLRATINSS